MTAGVLSVKTDRQVELLADFFYPKRITTFIDN